MTSIPLHRKASVVRDLAANHRTINDIARKNGVSVGTVCEIRSLYGPSIPDLLKAAQHLAKEPPRASEGLTKKQRIQIRAWAVGAGYEVSQKGIIPSQIVDLWCAAGKPDGTVSIVPEETPVSLWALVTDALPSATECPELAHEVTDLKHAAETFLSAVRQAKAEAQIARIRTVLMDLETATDIDTVMVCDRVRAVLEES